MDKNFQDHKTDDYKKLIESNDLGYHAGHGLTDESLKALVEHNLFIEYNIGHWIICDSIFNGLDKSINNLLNIINTRGPE